MSGALRSSQHAASIDLTRVTASSRRAAPAAHPAIIRGEWRQGLRDGDRSQRDNGRLRLSVGVGDWERALRLLPQVLRRAFDTHALKKEIKSVEQVMGVCARSGRWEEVLRVYELTCAMGTIPTFRAHACAAHASALLTGRSRPLLKTTQAMRAMQLSLGLAHFACQQKPPLLSTTLLLDGLTASNAPARLQRLARSAHEQSPSNTPDFGLVEELSRACTDAPLAFTEARGIKFVETFERVPEVRDALVVIHEALLRTVATLRGTRGGVAHVHTLPAFADSQLRSIAGTGVRLLLPDAQFVHHCFAELVQLSEGSVVVLTWSTVCELVTRAHLDPLAAKALEELLHASMPLSDADKNRVEGVHVLPVTVEMLLRELALEFDLDGASSVLRIAALSRALVDRGATRLRLLTRSMELKRAALRLGTLNM